MVGLGSGGMKSSDILLERLTMKEFILEVNKKFSLDQDKFLTTTILTLKIHFGKQPSKKLLDGKKQNAKKLL